MGRPETEEEKKGAEHNGEKEKKENGSGVAIHWFRHGLRLHDNPALLEAMRGMKELYCIFIFDGKVAGTQYSGYNRFRFLVQSLHDLDEQLQQYGARLYVFYGQVLEVFTRLFEEWNVERLTFEQDPEPIWQARDHAVTRLCRERNVECIERISLTLYDPIKVIEANGGLPPNTFTLLNRVCECLGHPPRPVPDPDFSSIKLPVADDFDKHFRIRTLEEMGKEPEVPEQLTPINHWEGGERKALALLDDRLIQEQKAYEAGHVMPNLHSPNLTASPTSMSPHLRFGCLSVRKFYWDLYDLYVKVVQEEPIQALNSQLMWREYFYVMSVNNPDFDRMEGNPICLQIPWYDNPDHLNKWKKGETGFPWIDACMKQLVLEGWIHHVCRQAVTCFLTRGDLWLNWVEGYKYFRKYQLDADYSVNSGNWMWMSSSAFEDCLQCPKCFSPVFYGMRMDPNGTYIRRYLPILKNMPLKYLFSPWKAPKEVQEKAGCVVGRDYPHPMVDHQKASKHCMDLMDNVKSKLKSASAAWHITPSNSEEARKMCWLPSPAMESQGPAGSVTDLADTLMDLTHSCKDGCHQ